MSLDTVLQIGKVLRSSENSLKYFKYVELCPKDKDGNWPICITVPVKEDFSFDWGKLYFTKEKEHDNLMYLKFKTSDSDNNPIKYLFGDVYYGLDKGVDKGGWFKLSKTKNKKGEITTHSFYEGEKFVKELLSKKTNLDILTKFRKSFEEDLSIIENVLKYHVGIELIKDEFIKVNQNILNNETTMMSYSARKIFDSLRAKKQYKKEINKVLKRDVNAWSEIVKDDYINLWKAYKGDVFLHFEFPNPQSYWYQYLNIINEIQDLIYQKFSSIKTIEKNGKKVSYYVFDSYLYKNICTGSDDNDKQSPGFTNDTKYKSKAFSFDDLRNLFYGDRHCSKESKLVSLSGTDIQIIVLPLGDNLKEKDYRDFIDNGGHENKITQANKEPLFDFVSNNSKDITKFDVVFCKKGGQSSPDKDLIELSGIEKSTLQTLCSRIETIAEEINFERNADLKHANRSNKLQIEISFRNILGNTLVDSNGQIVFKPSARYESHLLKVVPLIYTANYYNDNILLSSFIQVSEYIVRNVKKNYIWYNYTDLKYHLKFLLRIQNIKNDKFMEITSSESYQIGFMLGNMAKNLRMEINSFEKNYVGNLTRRIGTLPDFIKLKNEIEQKLIMHDKAKFTSQTSYGLAQKVKDFKSKYDKEECAFGFMESYFKPIPQKEVTTSDEVNSTNIQ